MSLGRREHIVDRRAKSTDGIISQQVVVCSQEGCKAEHVVNKNGKSRPPDVIYNMARRAGWKTDAKKGKHLCPEHANKRKPTMPKTAPTNSLKKPTEPNKADLRAIFRLIDEAYDDSIPGYADGVTDLGIAQKLKCPIQWVQKHREEHFGASGPDPRIAQLESRYTELEKRFVDMADRAMKLAVEVEAAQSDLKATASILKSMNGGVA